VPRGPGWGPASGSGMKVALLRVGIDSGSGGMQGPLFEDGSFEFVPIPDGLAAHSRTYGNTLGRLGRPFVEYFPTTRQPRMAAVRVHLDPEFDTFTYGDPAPPKSGLRRLRNGDLLVFYCGLAGWPDPSPPRLYLMGCFEVALAGLATGFDAATIGAEFGRNHHVLNRRDRPGEWEHLVLVKGGPGSRLFSRAVAVSAVGVDRRGKPLKVVSEEMRRIFGDFGGRVSIQRSPTRWVDPEHVETAAAFVRAIA
jgi:Nucleotide modification associated domain 3